MDVYLLKLIESKIKETRCTYTYHASSKAEKKEILKRVLSCHLPEGYSVDGFIKSLK